MTNQRKNVIVCGAAGGMGSAAVKLLMERGDVNVLAIDVADDALANRLGHIRGTDAELIMGTADLSKSEEVERSVEQAVITWGGLDGVLNYAGVVSEGCRIADATDDQYAHVMAMNAGSAWLVMKHAIPALLARGGGTLINTGSYLSLHGTPLGAAYAGAKHAVVGMTKSVALAYARDNIRANVLIPGATDTENIRSYFRILKGADEAAGRRQAESYIPTGRLSAPQELASVGVWALLDAPANMTGQLLVVDGGQSAT